MRFLRGSLRPAFALCGVKEARRSEAGEHSGPPSIIVTEVSKVGGLYARAPALIGPLAGEWKFLWQAGPHRPVKHSAGLWGMQSGDTSTYNAFRFTLAGADRGYPRVAYS